MDIYHSIELVTNIVGILIQNQPFELDVRCRKKAHQSELKKSSSTAPVPKALGVPTNFGSLQLVDPFFDSGWRELFVFVQLGMQKSAPFAIPAEVDDDILHFKHIVPSWYRILEDFNKNIQKLTIESFEGT